MLFGIMFAVTAYTKKNGAYAADVTENEIGQTGWTSAVPG